VRLEAAVVRTDHFTGGGSGPTSSSSSADPQGGRQTTTTLFLGSKGSSFRDPGSYAPVKRIANGSVTIISSAVKTNVEAASASYTL
jgi:hypothetical protein